jgi:transcriptional regulator with XRE-family HTH domain
VELIVAELPDVHRLEAYRYARGWTRADLSRAIDMLYERDGLRPPAMAAEQICNWEHGRAQPSPERLDYLCRVYETRPDRLGFGRDYADAGWLWRTSTGARLPAPLRLPRRGGGAARPKPRFTDARSSWPSPERPR